VRKYNMATDDPDDSKGKTFGSNDNNNNNNNSAANNKDNTITLSKSTFYKLVVIGIIALMVAAFFGGYNLNSVVNPVTPVTVPSALPTDTGTSPPPVTVTNITLGDAPSLGSSEAKVTVVEFSDFQCPFCASFFSNTLSQIKKEYVDTGKIIFVYKHFPLDFHQNAKQAAVASECAKEEGKFWEYHNILLGNQTMWENLGGNDTTETFVKYAESLGLDTDNFKSCLDSMKYERNVDMDLQEGSTMGVTGTPAFFVGTEGKEYTLMEGAQPFASFKQAIDGLL